MTLLPAGFRGAAQRCLARLASPGDSRHSSPRVRPRPGSRSPWFWRDTAPGSFLTRGAGDERVSGRACLKRTRFISPCGARHRTPGWKSRPWKQSGGSTCSGPGARRCRRGPRLFVPRMRQAWAGHLMEPFHAETSVLQLVGRNVDVSLISLPQVIKTKQQNLGNEAH